MQSYGELAHHFGEEIGCYFAFMQVRGARCAVRGARAPPPATLATL
jgi:hypothetical protein